SGMRLRINTLTECSVRTRFEEDNEHMQIDIREEISRWLTPAINPALYGSDWYEKRITTIESIANDVGPERTASLLHYYFQKGNNDVVSDIGSLIQADDLSFEKGNEFLNRLLVGVCLIKILQERSSSADAIGLVFSTFSFQHNLLRDHATALEADLAIA